MCRSRNESRFISVNRRSLSPAKRLREQLREAVRGEILDAAEQLIAAGGLHGAPLAAIAKGAGVAVGTLYNYFADRDALISALFEDRRASLKPKILAAVAAGKDLPFEPRIRALVRELLAAFDSHRLFIKVAIETEHLRLAPSTTANDLHAAIDEVMKIGVAEKQIKKPDAELAAFMLAGAIKSVVLRRTAGNQPFAADADALVSLYLDGVRR